jgi:F-type H+-transporting ATPase subunit delta
MDELDTQLMELQGALDESHELSALLSNPVLSTDMKLSTIDQLLSGGLRPDLRNFISLLLERGRGTYAAAIAARFHELVDEVHGRLQVDIESALPLSQEQIENIVAVLAKAYGKTILPRVRQNSDLIAGYRVQVGNRVLDATTANALRQFRDSLLAGAVGKEGTR